MQLLLISRDNLLSEMDSAVGDRIFRLLSTLTRQGFHLLATAPQPDKWAGEHGSPDDALLGPTSVRKKLESCGGILDGVYYVRRSMLTQKRNRVDALQDILMRYSAEPGKTFLFSASKSWVKAAQQMGFQATWINRGEDLEKELNSLAANRPDSP